MNEISALIKETPVSSLALFLLCEDTIYPGSRKQVSLDTKSAGTLILDFLASRTARNKICRLTHPVYDNSLEQLELKQLTTQ